MLQSTLQACAVPPLEPDSTSESESELVRQAPASRAAAQVPGSASGVAADGAAEHARTQESLTGAHAGGSVRAGASHWIGRNHQVEETPVRPTPMDGVVTEDGARALKETAEHFYAGRPVVLQSAPPHEGAWLAMMLKCPQEIAGLWDAMWGMHQREQPGGRAPSRDKTLMAPMRTRWMHERLNVKLAADQHTTMKLIAWQASLSSTHLCHMYGGKRMVQALWQTGIVWVPPLGIVPIGAAGRAATNCAKWCRRIARSARHHKEHGITIQAQARRATACGKHGRAPEEERLRRAMSEACHNFSPNRSLRLRVLIVESKRGKADTHSVKRPARSPGPKSQKPSAPLKRPAPSPGPK